MNSDSEKIVVFDLASVRLAQRSQLRAVFQHPSVRSDVSDMVYG
jgi:hypothetical protein